MSIFNYDRTGQGRFPNLLFLLFNARTMLPLIWKENRGDNN